MDNMCYVSFTGFGVDSGNPVANFSFVVVQEDGTCLNPAATTASIPATYNATGDALAPAIVEVVTAVMAAAYPAVTIGSFNWIAFQF